jgi:hypothetical protein
MHQSMSMICYVQERAPSHRQTTPMNATDWLPMNASNRRSFKWDSSGSLHCCFNWDSSGSSPRTQKVFLCVSIAFLVLKLHNIWWNGE